MGKRNPNGYGCVTKLKGNRSKPWIVKVTISDEEGHSRQVPVGYEESEEKANILLAQYNNNPWDIDREKVTLAILFQRWSSIKLPKLGTSTQRTLKAAYKHCSKYYGMKYRKMKSFHMQHCIDNCGLSYATQAAIKNLFGHLDRFAFELDIIDKMYSQLTSVESVPETTRGIFTDEQIEQLWGMSEKTGVDTVLIYLYTGFRLTELLTMKTAYVDLENKTFKGGVKSANGKNRVVPIHHRIEPLVRKCVEQGNEYLFTSNRHKFSTDSYYRLWYSIMGEIGADKTPHEARHTFETRLDNAGGNRKCIDLLMGHKSKDTGNRVYNHKTIEQLKETIELLK